MEKSRPPTSYSAEDAAHIIREATELSLGKQANDNLSSEELHKMAEELGLDEESVRRAIASRSQRAERQAARKQEVRKLARQGVGYGLTLVGLTVINFFTGGGWWVQWAALGFGIALTMRIIHVLRAMLHDGSGT